MKIAGKMQALVALALLGAGLIVAGCKSAPELTKEQAQALIQAKYDSMPGTPFVVAVNDLGMQEGVTAGYWVGVKRYPNGYWGDFKLTPAGEKVLKFNDGGNALQWRPLQPQDPNYTIAITPSVNTKLKADNFGDVENLGSNKIVTFSEEVDLSAFPAPLQGLAHNPGNRLSNRRTATFVLNNNAWALQSID